MTDQPETPPRTPRRIWNFTPALPLQLAPYWDWPLRPLASLVYLLKSWNPVGMRLMFLIAAAVTWTFFTPDLSRAANGAIRLGVRSLVAQFRLC